MQQADDIHAALGLDLEVGGSARPHALMPHEGALAEQLHCIQVHVCTVQHQLHLAEGSLSQSAHNDVLVHKGDALWQQRVEAQTSLGCDVVLGSLCGCVASCHACPCHKQLSI